MRTSIIFLIVSTIIAHIGVLSHVTAHEFVHAIIFRDFGCKIDKIHINYLTLEGYTKATCTNLTKEETLFMTLQHNLNEAIAYNVTPILITLLSIIIFGFYVLITKLEKIEELLKQKE